MDDLRKIATAARPAIKQWLEAAEELAAFSDLCRTKELDWAQIKALLKAEYQDGEDGGDRVEKIRAKAERASEYADILSSPPPKNISGNVEQPKPPVRVSVAAGAVIPASADARTMTRPEQQAMERATAELDTEIDAALGVPSFLYRGPDNRVPK